jgi:hypothetical protein
LRALRLNIGERGALGSLSLCNLRLGLAKIRFELLRVETRDDLSRSDGVAFVDKHFLDSAREFRRDEKLVRFEATIACGDAVWETRLGKHFPADERCHRDNDRDDDHHARGHRDAPPRGTVPNEQLKRRLSRGRGLLHPD